MIKEIFPALRTTIVLATFSGLLFPFAITAVAQLVFAERANGSLIFRDSRLIGSELIGQSFEKPEYFHSRPSAAGSGYAGEASGGTNLGPTSKKLIEGSDDFEGIATLTKKYRDMNGLKEDQMVPPDAVSRSASGLDPHISLSNARLQVGRVAIARNISADSLRQILNEHIEDRTLGVLGEPRVNVLKINNYLDQSRSGCRISHKLHCRFSRRG